METSDFYGTEKVSRILLKIAPPVMLAQLIQALYNIVDSFFVGKYSETGLTALSIIYPVQLLMIALGVGTGVGINTDMAYYLGIGKKKKAEEVAGTGTPLGLILWIIFAAVCYVTLPAYAGMSTDSPEVIRDVVAYGRIVCLFSIGLFPGNRICREEFGTDDRENRVVFCAAGIYFFKIRFAVFLADFPGNRAAYLCDRSWIL